MKCGSVRFVRRAIVAKNTMARVPCRIDLREIEAENWAGSAVEGASTLNFIPSGNIRSSHRSLECVPHSHLSPIYVVI